MPICVKLMEYNKQTFVSVSVTQIAWFDEDRPFAVAYSDGVISLCTKLEIDCPQDTKAFDVSFKVD